METAHGFVLAVGYERANARTYQFKASKMPNFAPTEIKTYRACN